MTQVDSLANIDWENLVSESVKIKKTITEADPNERGIRKVLNFGHTLGHAIESFGLSSKKQLFHGEAIAIGMIMETYLSHLKGYLSLEDAQDVKDKILKLYGHHPSVIPETKSLLALMSKDKKNKGGVTKFSLLQKLGEGNFDQEATTSEIEQAILFYKA